MGRALFRALAGVAGVFALAPVMAAPSLAATATECTAINICYCVNADLKAVIDANVARLRQRITEEKSKGKAIGFLSIPLSTAGGGCINVNKEIAAQAKARFGENSHEFSIPVRNRQTCHPAPAAPTTC